MPLIFGAASARLTALLSCNTGSTSPSVRRMRELWRQMSAGSGVSMRIFGKCSPEALSHSARSAQFFLIEMRYVSGESSQNSLRCISSLFPSCSLYAQQPCITVGLARRKQRLLLRRKKNVIFCLFERKTGFSAFRSNVGTLLCAKGRLCWRECLRMRRHKRTSAREHPVQRPFFGYWGIISAARAL